MAEQDGSDASWPVCSFLGLTRQLLKLAAEVIKCGMQNAEWEAAER
jgi:hypothetical protein